MNQQEERQRLINIRECLRWVQTRLPTKRQEEDTTKGSEFICVNVRDSHFDQQTKSDTVNLIVRGVAPYGTFNSWMHTHNGERVFGYREMMRYRQCWINQLCRSINKRLNQL